MDASAHPVDLAVLTFEQAEDRYRYGQWSERDWRRYERAWTWGAARFGGSAAIEQDRLHARTGSIAARVHRSERIKAALAALARGEGA